MFSLGIALATKLEYKLRHLNRAEVNRWLIDLCHELESEVPERLIRVGEVCCDEKTKYVFKSYEAQSGKPLVLLEENRCLPKYFRSGESN